MAHLSRPGDASHFEIAFFCALEAERHAIELALDEQYETEGIIYPRDPHDPNAYTTGRIGTHHVVIVYLTGVGNIESAAAAANLPMTFPGIKLAIAVGVCGVDPKARDYDEQEVLLGDVIVSTAVLRSSYGHQYGDGFALGRDVDTIRLPPIAIRSFLNRLEGITAFRRLKQKIVTYTETILDRGLRPHGEYPGPEKQVLYDAAYQHKHSKPYECETCAHCQQPFHNPCYSALQTPCETLGCDEAFQIDRPKIRIARGFHADGTPLHGRDQVASAQRPSLLFGKFASADSVMASAYHRDQLVRERGVVAFERAGAGCWDYIPTIIVKGACDYADGHTNEVWRQYSAINAVACAKAIVEEWRSEALPENSGRYSVSRFYFGVLTVSRYHRRDIQYSSSDGGVL
jgi:nucleoside phosphorylase